MSGGQSFRISATSSSERTPTASRAATDAEVAVSALPPPDDASPPAALGGDDCDDSGEEDSSDVGFVVFFGGPAFIQPLKDAQA